VQLTELLAAIGSDAASFSVPENRARPSAVLVLADGSVFSGVSIGASGNAVGEVVFNTAITGYQEILTDPSYCRQIVTLTYPHIGSTGWNEEDDESESIQAAGLVIRDLPSVVSNFRSKESLSEALAQRGVVAIAGVDTRRLTRLLRDTGAQSGCILAAEPGESIDEDRARILARGFGGLVGLDLAQHVSTKTPYEWTEGSWRLVGGHGQPKSSPLHVVAYDFGVKRNILRLLADRGCRLTVVPAKTPVSDVLAMKPSGIFLSNGPGDPEPCDYAIAAAKEAIDRRIPLFGICLGHQILALAAGARTLKMKFGHHGANHPVQDLASGRVFITSQNHGFAVDPKSLPAHLKVTHRSLFDGSIQGLAHTEAPAFCFQGHPEASPGPHDIVSLFDHFFDLMRRGAHA